MLKLILFVVVILGIISANAGVLRLYAVNDGNKRSYLKSRNGKHDSPFTDAECVRMYVCVYIYIYTHIHSPASSAEVKEFGLYLLSPKCATLPLQASRL
jgi:hypothetical protein